MADIENRGTLLQLLTDAQTALARIFEHRASEWGLNRPQWRVLSGVYNNDGVTQTELSHAIGVAPSPLGKIVDRLEAAGYLERRPDAADRRIKRLYVTSAVAPLVEPVRELLSELEDAVLGEIGADARFVEQLARLRDEVVAMVTAERATP